MQRWFRFCALIALMAFTQSSMAQSSPATASGKPEASEEVPVSKHRIKASVSEVLQFNLDKQSKRIDEVGAQIESQTNQITAQTKQIDELTKLAELQTKQIETLNADLNRLTSVLLSRGAGIAEPSSPPVHPSSGETPAPVKTAEPVEPQPAPVAPDGSPTYVVKRGETLISIARQHGTTVSELLKINKIEDERKLQIGQTIILPKTSPKLDSQ